MFIDSHCHFNFNCFKAEQENMLSELAKVNINKLIVPGTDAKRWSELIALSEKYQNVYFSLGIHPHFLDDFENTQLIKLNNLLKLLCSQKKTKCVALGEIGLDKLIATDLVKQEEVFLAQLEIAKSLQLPIILHVVKTQSRVLQLLKQSQFSYGGVYHAFSGSEEIANEFIKLGFKLGIGGVITYPSAKKTRQTLKKVPLHSLLLETDAPDMPIYQQPTRHNSPLNLLSIFQSLCELREEPPQQVSQQIYENTKRIFSIIND